MPMHGKLKGVAKLLFYALLAIVVPMSGCALVNLILGDVKFNDLTEGKLDFSDDNAVHGAYTFYSDRFETSLKAGKSYSLELWTDSGVPIHFQCDDLGQDLGCWSDADGTWDGYLLYEFPSAYTGKLAFCFYLRADHVSADSWYKFRINEK